MGKFVESMPKCNIWGVDILIVISVGASEYPFDRFIKIIDEICNEKIINGKDVIAQIGKSNYKPKNFESFQLIGREEFQQYIEKADIIITHAGTGCVVPALKLQKKVIIFPRMVEYNEHLDNHQLELSDAFEKEGYVLCAKNKNELINCIKKSSQFIPKKFISNKDDFNKLIIDCIEKM